jgi:hypothetical protein
MMFMWVQPSHAQSWTYNDSECEDFIAQVAFSVSLASQCNLKIRNETKNAVRICKDRFSTDKVASLEANGLKFAKGFRKRNGGAQFCTSVADELGPMLEK